MRHHWVMKYMLVSTLVAISVGCRCHRDVVPAGTVRNATCCDTPPQAQIDFLALRQNRPEQYVLGPRDTLGIYIEGVTGEKETPPPVHFPDDPKLQPSIGYPVPIRDDGYISLPLIDSINVDGLTLAQAERKILEAYTDGEEEMLKKDNAKIIITLMKPRNYNILVVREDLADNRRVSYRRNEVFIGEANQGQTFSISLPAYENDVLHALSETGGMPGEAAKNEIIVMRGGMDAMQVDPTGVFNAIEQGFDQYGESTKIIRIPVKFDVNNVPILNESDIVLNDGDVIYIQGRDRDVFYTAGLLEGGRFPLPRDYEVDVLEAIAMAGGSVSTAAGSSNNNGFSGIGNVMPASRVTILRMIDCQQCAIEVDLKCVIADPTQRTIIMPGDIISLEYCPGEVVVNSVVSLLQIGGIYQLFNN